jgi:hypothetical protein
MDIPNASFNRENREFVQRHGKIIDVMKHSFERDCGQSFWVLDEDFYIKDRGKLNFVMKLKRKIRVYKPEEIRSLLRKSGFEIEEIFQYGSLKKFLPSSKRMIIIAR